MEIRMEHMTWPEVKQALKNGYNRAVVGIGSTEQHGPHLPLMTDARIGDALAFGVAARLGKMLVAPTIRPGCSEHHMSFPGTISLSNVTLKAVIRDVVHSLRRHGFKAVVLLSSHGGNLPAVGEIIDELSKEYTDILVTGYTDIRNFVDVFIRLSGEYSIPPETAGAHAGENETSIMKALEPDLVVSEGISPGYTGPLTDRELGIILKKGLNTLTENGIIGDPRESSAEKGRAYLQGAVDFFAEEIGALLEASEC